MAWVLGNLEEDLLKEIRSEADQILAIVRNTDLDDVAKKKRAKPYYDSLSNKLVEVEKLRGLLDEQVCG